MIVKCANDHWYDNTINEECPHCKEAGDKLIFRVDPPVDDDRTRSLDEVEELIDFISEDRKKENDIPTVAPQEWIEENQQPQVNDWQPVAPSPSFNWVSAEELEDVDENKTLAFGFAEELGKEPVVGWLVCMNGGEIGSDFRIHAGKNFVGRSSEMDIILTDDKTISREKACAVTYDPRSNRFFVSCEEGNIVYLNDKRVMTHEELKEGDVIMIGESNLCFIPYCRENRVWGK